MDGVVLINKPKGPTSHDVVARLRRLAGTRRVGHAGTLDPMATGLLVCCIERATRIVPYLIGLPKEYTGEMVLGASSDTYDAEGKITPGADAGGVGAEALREAFRSQTGVIEQTAPPYSAVKVRGKKLYEYARENNGIAPSKLRTVWVERFEPVRYLPPRVTFAARVGSGTYIRALVHAVGLHLGCGAYLSQLCRTRIGGFSVDDASLLEDLEAAPDTLSSVLLSIPEALVHLPKLILLPKAESRLRNGAAFSVDDILECEGPQPIGRPTLVLSAQGGDALAIVEAATSEALYRPLCVLAVD